MLKPQDAVVAIKLFLVESKGNPMTFAALGGQLKISSSEVHSAVKRGLEAGLLIRRLNLPAMPKANPAALEEFLIHGLKYVWPAKPHAILRGLATGTSLHPVAQRMGVPLPAQGLVWKHPLGETRGESVVPLYPRVVDACMEDNELHEWLALVDVIRIRKGREGELASRSISQLLKRLK